MTASPSSAVAVPPPGRYRIDPQRSTVRYSGRHMFGLGGVQATFQLNDGTITVADPVTASSIELIVDPASFTSDKTRRDVHVRSRSLLDVEAHPEITFRSAEVRPDGEHWVVRGEVTAHGVSRPVEVRVDRAGIADDELTMHAVAQLDRYEFGVTKVKGMAGRRLTLDFDLVAVAD